MTTLPRNLPPIDRAPQSVPPGPLRVLVVEDNEQLRRLYVRVLSSEGFVVVAAEGGAKGAELLARQDFNVVLTDLSMPGLDGMALLRLVRERDLDVPVVLVTGSPDVRSAADAVRYGACQYLTKPVDLAQLLEVLRRAVELGRAARLHRETMNALESGTFRAGDRSDLEASFERAVEGLWMAYHPIVRCSTQALFGYEALMRTSDTSLPTPGTILNAAESLGRLDDLGRTVRARVAQQIADAPEEAVLFVNVHARDLEDKTLTWSSTPLAQVANRVVLELAERAALDKIDNLPMRIQELREMGFRIAIDDLGAGYAGLTSFALLEPEFIKLDISLIRDVDRSRTKQKLIQTMTSLARDMGMLVVAEGVETLEERATVIELGCDFVQGFLLARPGGAFPHYRW